MGFILDRFWESHHDIGAGWENDGVYLTLTYGFGKPVIVTNTGGLSEYIWHKKTGFIVTPGDHRQLAKSICSILVNPETQQEIKSNIEEMKKVACNWKIVADKSVTILF